MKIQNQSVLVAHRGLPPENTLWAFKHAYAQGFVAAECDVWITQDNQVVVCHDETLERTAVSSSNLLKRPLSLLTAEQLKTILVGDDKHSEPVPLLQDLLQLIPDQKLLLVEIKFQDCDKLSFFIECIQVDLHKIIVISFYPEILAVLKQQLPMCRTILLTTARPYTEETVIINDLQSLRNALLLLQELKLDGVGFEYSEFITPENLSLLPEQLLTELWYGEKNPEKVKSIIDIALDARIEFINIDS